MAAMMGISAALPPVQCLQGAFLEGISTRVFVSWNSNTRSVSIVSVPSTDVTLSLLRDSPRAR
jgi:hypothetical protein